MLIVFILVTMVIIAILYLERKSTLFELITFGTCVQIYSYDRYRKNMWKIAHYLK
jgi:hypothetical protein